VPTPPAATTSRASAKPAANRRLNPTCNGTPAARAASIARSASASENAIGFSQNTGLPAAAAATTSSVWLRAVDAITTASTSSASIIDGTSVWGRAPYVPASFSAAPGAGSATAASSACGIRSASDSAW
jgi:hypothetical protein